MIMARFPYNGSLKIWRVEKISESILCISRNTYYLHHSIMKLRTLYSERQEKAGRKKILRNQFCKSKMSGIKY